jgi:glucosylceramidase
VGLPSWFRLAFTSAGFERVVLAGLVALVGLLVISPPHVAWGRRTEGSGRRACRGRGHSVRCPDSVRVGAKAQVVLTTADLSQGLAPQRDLTFEKAAPRGVVVIRVDDAVTYQRFLGAGGAMTDSSAWLIQGLSSDVRASVMRSLFAPTGLDLDFLRVPIGASDFTAGGVPYTYDDVAAGLSDPRLAQFSIAHDESYIIPALREALALQPGVRVLASPWTAPAWMKTNDRLDNVGRTGVLKPSAYDAYARYLVKFIKSYQREGVAVADVTPQNEPGNPTAYPGMSLDERGEAAFIRFHLVPALRRARLRTGIYGFDEGWGVRRFGFARKLARSRAAADLVGIATHCYRGAPTAISRLHHENPKLIEIVSECASSLTPNPTSEVEIASLRNWASAVLLFNLALDPTGGPVQPPDSGCPGCTGLVTVDPAAQSASRTIDYYELGQLSKFVHPGAVRIATDHFVSYGYSAVTGIASPGLDDVAFRNPDGTEALLAYNSAPTPVSFAVDSHGRYAPYQLAPGSTATLLWRVHTG